MMDASWHIPLTDPSQVGEARRLATALAHHLLLNETESGKVALVVTEIGTNIQRHAARGEILIRSVADQSGLGVEILGVDHGSGMSNVNLCLKDGFSTTGTSGLGLGGIRRLSHTFAIDSMQGRGTCILSRIYRDHPVKAESSKNFDVGLVALPHPHEKVSGDGYVIHQEHHVCTAMVVDGLGHGPLAAEAAKKACRIVEQDPAASLEDMIQNLHAGLKGTRGAALGLARIDAAAGVVQFLGVGNIAGSLIQRDGSSKSVISMPGIVGHEMRKARSLSYPWTDHTTLVLHSDGLLNHWNAVAYLPALGSEASILAAALYRDFNRGRDDTTVVAIKKQARKGSVP